MKCTVLELKWLPIYPNIFKVYIKHIADIPHEILYFLTSYYIIYMYTGIVNILL